MGILEYLNSNSGAIQAVTVVILLLITGWYAYTTSKMSQIMIQEYALKSRPFLSVTKGIDRRYHVNAKQLQIVVNVKNVGSVPILFKTVELMLASQTVNPPELISVLLPDESTLLYSNGIALPNVDEPINAGQGLEGRIKLIFWSDGIPSVKYFYAREFYFGMVDETFTRSENIGIIKEN